MGFFGFGRKKGQTQAQGIGPRNPQSIAQQVQPDPQPEQEEEPQQEEPQQRQSRWGYGGGWQSRQVQPQQQQQQYSGPPQEGWQNWFNSLTAGKTANSQTLESMRGEIESRGARLGNANAQGIIDSIILPDERDSRGRVIDVGQSFSGTPGSNQRWQWGDWGWGDNQNSQPSMGAGGQMGGSMGMWGQQQQFDPQKMMDMWKQQQDLQKQEQQKQAESAQTQMHHQFRANQLQRTHRRGTGMGIGPSQKY